MFREIDDKLKQISSCRPLSQGELERLQEAFLIDYTYNSNAIEGNTLTLQETAMVLSEGITIAQKPLKDHLEVIGHKEAFYYIEEMVKEKIELTERIIQDIHSIVLMDRPQDKGVYRRIPVRIMNAVHEPVQPYLIPVQMEQLMKAYQSEKMRGHLFERVALFHLQFEAIHPFIDGNGRTGRLVMNLELMKNGYPPINIKFQDRQRYYNCFTDYHQNNYDASSMVAMIAEYSNEEISRYLEIVTIANQIRD